MGVCKNCQQAVICPVAKQPPCPKCRKDGNNGDVVVDHMGLQLGSLIANEFRSPSFDTGTRPACGLHGLKYLPPPGTTPKQINQVSRHCLNRASRKALVYDQRRGRGYKRIFARRFLTGSYMSVCDTCAYLCKDFVQESFDSEDEDDERLIAQISATSAGQAPLNKPYLTSIFPEE